MRRAKANKCCLTIPDMLNNTDPEAYVVCVYVYVCAHACVCVCVGV